jgi:S1-C subfamily serine protease
VGVHKDTDLALLKIDATALPYLPLDPKRPITQGQLVFALGNAEGLGSSVTMGVVSAVDRHLIPDCQWCSSKPKRRSILIDIDGYVLGISTFILSESGGSEGLGFAIPARVVSFVFDRLRKSGHMLQIERSDGMDYVAFEID